jgi:hypothetical protein
MATYKDNWDLRAGFTKDYDLATSAVKEADKQFASAQEIVKDAYALDRTAATQEGEINRMNQENLEKLLGSQERVGEFQSQQEIQRALDSLGYGEQPVSTEADQPPEQPRPEVVTDDGRTIPDPAAPINAVPNAQKPPSTRPAARPMTQIERLQAVEPMLASPRAKATLRNMVVKESMNEARMLATIAPDEAFNGLIKHGVIRGNPLIANDDGTYTRTMPDGKNQIRIDRNEAAAWVGDVINKTNNQYKLIEERRQLGEKVAADKDLDKAKTGNKIYADQQQTNENIREKGYEYGLKTKLEGTKAGYDFGLARLRAGLASGNIRLRASLEGASGGEGGDGGYRAGSLDFAGNGASSAATQKTPEAPARSVDLSKLSPEEANDLLGQVKEQLKKVGVGTPQANFLRGKAAELQALAAKGGDMNRVATQMFDDAMKDIAASSGGRPLIKTEFNRELQDLKKQTNALILSGKPIDAKATQRKIDAIVKRAKEQ